MNTKKQTIIWKTMAMLAAFALLAACVPATLPDDWFPDNGVNLPPPSLMPIFVEKIENLPPDFMLGVDISSVISLEHSGVVFRDWYGYPADLFELFADGGANWVRVRIWNNPWLDAPGVTGPGGYRRGFGGGNNDVDRAIEIGRRATDAGMRVLVNFHYSDFWADPGKQTSPRAWQGMNMEARGNALFDFTYDAITRMLQAGIDVGMVQIGNETNSAMAGVSGAANVAALIRRGSEAVIEAERSFRRLPSGNFNRDILIAVHKTNPQNLTQLRNIANALYSANVVYDVFGLSYYWFWHGPVSGLQTSMNAIASEFEVDVAVFEVSWPFTATDTDGHPNNWSGGAALGGPGGATPPHPINVQGQADAIREVAHAVANVPGGRGLGVFVWEPAWITVGPINADLNRPIWERHGSGWASSYAADYDTGARDYSGGSSWDNQAFFDRDGHPIRTLRLFYYLREGSPPIDPTGNLLLNYSFEEIDMAMWRITLDGVSNPPNVYDGDGIGRGVGPDIANPRPGGDWGFRWWRPATNPIRFTIEQDVYAPVSGQYRFEIFITGGDSGSNTAIYIYARVNGGAPMRSPTPPFNSLPGWGNWHNPSIEVQANAGDTITVGASLDFPNNTGGVWGTLDDFSLVLIDD